MTVPFILMTIAFMGMAIFEILQERRYKKLRHKFDELNDKGWREYWGAGKEYRRSYRFIILEHYDQNALNYTADRFQNDGYNYDREKSTDRLLVFVKTEEVKPKEE